MRGHPVGQGLNQGGATTGPGPVHRLSGYAPDRDQVVAVYRNPGYPVALGFLGDALHLHLLVGGHADGPAVVLHHDQQGGVEDRREVEPFVKVALGGAAVADEYRHHGVLAHQPLGMGHPGGLGDLGGDGDVKLHHVDVGRRAPAGRVGPPAQDQLADGHAKGEGRGALAVAGQQPVVIGAQTEGHPHLGRFLAAKGWVDPQPALALQDQHTLVEVPGPAQSPVALEEFFGAEG